MSEGIKNKAVKTFEDLISVNQRIIGNRSYEALPKAGDIMVKISKVLFVRERLVN